MYCFYIVYSGDPLITGFEGAEKNHCQAILINQKKYLKFEFFYV